MFPLLSLCRSASFPRVVSPCDITSGLGTCSPWLEGEGPKGSRLHGPSDLSLPLGTGHHSRPASPAVSGHHPWRPSLERFGKPLSNNCVDSILKPSVLQMAKVAFSFCCEALTHMEFGCRRS